MASILTYVFFKLASWDGNPFHVRPAGSPPRSAPALLALFCSSLCAGYIHSPQLFPVSRASNMPTCQSTACIALAAVITLIAGVSDAFVAPSLSSKIDARGRSNTRAGRSSSCLSMGADGGTTRGEQRGDVVRARQRQQ